MDNKESKLDTVETPEEATIAEPETTDESEASISEEVQKELDNFSGDEVESEDTSESESEDAADIEISDDKSDKKVADDLDDFFDDDSSEKTGIDKRIDKLTAEKYKLRAELEEYKARIAELKSKTKDVDSDFDIKKSEWSDPELDEALTKAMDDGDTKLVSRILNEKFKNAKYDLAEAYRKQQESTIKKQQAQQREWQTIVSTYDYLADENEPELYANSHVELNIGNPESLWFQLARKLYMQNDEDSISRYRSHGGMQLAAADALKLILKKRNKKIGQGKDAAKLERRLAKAKRKQSIGAATSEKSESKKGPSKPKTAKDKLDDYIKERKAAQNKSMGF